ncbi:MAG: ribbon-helix-helix domain-containing protein [Candidatus Omnitrophota bacterium]
MTTQLSTRIDTKAKQALDQLHKKTHVPIRILTEKAIFLLKEKYDRMSSVEEQQGAVDEVFMGLLDYSLRKLAD